MASSGVHNCRNRSGARARAIPRRLSATGTGGFTLIEILVVVRSSPAGQHPVAVPGGCRSRTRAVVCLTTCAFWAQAMVTSRMRTRDRAG